jgi:uncharacterized small protein (DUF1192 family)
MLNLLRRKGRPVALVCALALGACQTIGGPPLTADEELLRTQSDGFVAENVAGGAVTGAAIGCLLLGILSVAANNNASSAGTACAIGAGVGAVVGGVDGYMNAKEAQYKANETAMMASMADDVRADNQKLAEMIETSSRVVENDRRRLQELSQKVTSKEITLEQARSEASVIRSNSEQIESILDEARKKRELYEDARGKLDTNNTAELDSEIDRLNTEISRLETQLAAVNSALRVSGLG